MTAHAPLDALHTPTGRLVQVCTTCETDDGDWVLWPCAVVRDGWTCQACGQDCPAGDVVCARCGGRNRRSEPVGNDGSYTRVVLESEGRTKTVPGGAPTPTGDLTTGTSPALLGEGGKPDGYPA